MVFLEVTPAGFAELFKVIENQYVIKVLTHQNYGQVENR